MLFLLSISQLIFILVFIFIFFSSSIYIIAVRVHVDSPCCCYICMFNIYGPGRTDELLQLLLEEPMLLLQIGALFELAFTLV